MNRPYVIAHRGAVSVAPENSVEAIAAAADLGADAAEIDVQLTADGVPVLLHDRTVDRTTDGHGPIARLTWHEVKTFHGRGGVKLPTLDDALAVAAEHDLRLAIELKQYCPHPPRSLAEVVVHRLAEHGLLETCWVWAFRLSDLRAMRDLAPQVVRGGLSLGWPSPEMVALSDLIIPLAAHLASLWPWTVQRYAQPVIAWTIDSPSIARRLREAGVAGVITNDVARICGALEGGDRE